MIRPVADPELMALLKEAANRKMTAEEIAAQRKSWAIGQFLLSHPDRTREEAEAIYANLGDIR